MDRPQRTSESAPRRTVALVVPLYNEEAVASLLVREIEAFREAHPEVVEVVLVDDGSRDGTADKVRTLASGKPGYVLARFSRNFGHQIAITAGMEFVTADAAIIMDADLQDPLSVAAEMIDKWREGYDVVYGLREEREGETVFKRATAWVFYRFFDHMTDVQAPRDTGDFRLVSRRVLDAYRRFGESQPFVRGLIAWLGFEQTGIRYRRPPRAAGRTKYSFRKSVRLAVDSITSFSQRPLWYAIGVGMTISFLSIAGIAWALLQKYAFGGVVPGWTSLIFAAFFFGGVQLFFLGVTGAYLARVYEEVKGRPRYLLRDVWRSTGDTGDAPA